MFMNSGNYTALDGVATWQAMYTNNNPYGYDFNKTVSSSSGSGTSDESMNASRTEELKQNPKYREKRNKNNLAAKKSRAHRKQRELDLRAENDDLKEKANKTAAQLRELLQNHDAMMKNNAFLLENANALTKERDDLRLRIQYLESQLHAFRNDKSVFRDITKQINVPEPPVYATLQ